MALFLGRRGGEQAGTDDRGRERNPGHVVFLSSSRFWPRLAPGHAVEGSRHRRQHRPAASLGGATGSNKGRERRRDDQGQLPPTDRRHAAHRCKLLIKVAKTDTAEQPAWDEADALAVQRRQLRRN